MLSKSYMLMSVALLGVCGFAIADTDLTEDTDLTLLPTITVTATKSSENVDQSTLNDKAIQQIQAQKIGELLNYIPGVAAQGSVRPNGQSLNIWGFADQEDVKISVDGASKNYERYQMGTIFVDPELIKRVEVNKGNFDVRQSNGGFGGKVELTTKDADDFLEAEQNIGGFVKYGHYSNNSENLYSLGIFAREGIWDALIYGNIRKSGDPTLANGEKLKYSPVNDYSYLFKNKFNFDENNKLTISYMHNKHHAWEVWAAKSPTNTINITESDIEKYGEQEAVLRRLVNRTLEDKTFVAKFNTKGEVAKDGTQLLDATITYSWSRTKEHYNRLSSASASLTIGQEFDSSFTDNNIDLYNKATFNWGVFNHSLLFGGAYQHTKRTAEYYLPNYKDREDYNFGKLAPYFNPEGTTKLISFYLSDDIKGGDFIFSPGLRWDYVKNIGIPNKASRYNTPEAGHDYSPVTYKGLSKYFNVKYQINKNVMLFGGIANTWRAPLIDEQYETQAATSSRPATSVNLKPEKITQYRAGLAVDLRNVVTDHDSLSLRAAYFFLNGKDEIFKNVGTYCYAEHVSGNKNSCTEEELKNVPVYTNLNGYRNYGYELEAYYYSRYVFASLAGSTIKSYWSYVSPYDRWYYKDVMGSQAAPRRIVATLGFRIPQYGVALGWKTELVGRVDRTSEDDHAKAKIFSISKAPGYSLHGVFATYESKHLNVYLTIDNLFNRVYKNSLTEATIGLGRNIKTSVSVKF